MSRNTSGTSHQAALKPERGNEERGRIETGEGDTDHVGHRTATGTRETLSGTTVGTFTITTTEEREDTGGVTTEETGKAGIREPRASSGRKEFSDNGRREEHTHRPASLPALSPVPVSTLLRS